MGAQCEVNFCDLQADMSSEVLIDRRELYASDYQDGADTRRSLRDDRLSAARQRKASMLDLAIENVDGEDSQAIEEDSQTFNKVAQHRTDSRLNEPNRANLLQVNNNQLSRPTGIVPYDASSQRSKSAGSFAGSSRQSRGGRLSNQSSRRNNVRQQYRGKVLTNAKQRPIKKPNQGGLSSLIDL